MSASVPARHLARVTMTYAEPVGWLVIGVGGLIGYLAGIRETGPTPASYLLVMMSLFFVALTARLIAAMVLWPQRRLALGALTVGVVLWAAGSTLVNSGSAPGASTFPAPGEWLFLISYSGFAAFLVLDATVRPGKALSAWLDAVIVCGAAAAVASIVLLTPFTRFFPQGGVPLLVALIYPFVDLTLALVVLAQVALGMRSWSRRTVALMGGFVLLAAADCSLVLNLTSEPYAFTMAVILVWATSLMLIVSAGCRPRAPLSGVSRRLPGVFLVLSFLLAVGLLVARPPGMTGLAVALPAVCTLLACAGRLVIALSESRAASEALHLARTDDLTGLPNRRALLREVDRAIAAQESFALMLLDLDGFKDVNDTLGHSAGDTLLELAALRVKQALPPTMMLARVGGDEFAVLVRNEDEIELLERAQGIRRALLAPARIDGLDLAMHASLGIALVTPDDRRAVDLLRRADIAMYEAKVSRSGAQLYSPEHDEFSRQRLQMGEELRRALGKGQVTAWYQPKVDAVTKDVVGFEALVRWEHPDEGMLPPAAFLPVARRAGLMQELSQVVVDKAVDSAARWRRIGLDLHVAINVAPPELLGGLLLPLIYQALHRADLPPHAVTIEVTEDSFLADPQRAREVLLDVHEHGLQVSVDDYGTGFSSLAYLRDLPISELKLDKSFVSTMTRDQRSSLIVASTIDMAHALDLRVVAEGVEDTETITRLMSMGVDTLQGYRISQPMPAASVLPWVHASHLPTAPLRLVADED